MNSPSHPSAFPSLRRNLCLLGTGLVLSCSGVSAAEISPDRAKNLVILDPIGVENLGLKTVRADNQTFEQVIFAIGRVEAIPASRAIISSLAPGRVQEIKIAPGDAVKSGAELLRLEAGENRPDPQWLTAPISGLVTALHVSQGESFRRATNLAEITDLQAVDLIARVPEHEAALLKPGANARILVPAACDKIFRTTLVRFGTEGDRKHGTVEAYYRLENRDLLMRPGMRAEFRIVAAERKVSAVPRDAVQGTAAQRFVFVKDFEIPNAFVRTPVVTGQRNDRFVEIVKGLMPGDEVVTTGAYALTSAGGGTVSLKAALDAAHGHAHDEHGAPIHGSEGGTHHGHNHAATPEPSSFTPLTIFFATQTVILAGLLWLSRRRSATAA